jgi:hypothetical protein
MDKVDKLKRNELRCAIKAMIGEKKIQRSTKKKKEDVLSKTMAELGLDKTKFMKDLEQVQKENNQYPTK